MVKTRYNLLKKILPVILLAVPIRAMCATDFVYSTSTLDTGLMVYQGQTITVAASGQWQVNWSNVYADGVGSGMNTGVVPSAPVGALIAKVDGGAWFYVGESTAMVYSGPPGPLVFHMNVSYNYTDMVWNYPSGTSGQLNLTYSVSGDTHAVLSGTLTYSGGTTGYIILNAVSYTPTPVVISTLTIPTTDLAPYTSYYTMSGIELNMGYYAEVAVTARIDGDASQHGTSPNRISLGVGQHSYGGNVTIYPGEGVLKGTVTYSGTQTNGNMVVALFSDLDGNPVATAVMPNGISTFSVSGIPGPDSYYVLAFKDLNDNNKPDGPEAFGYYGTAGPLSLLTTNADPVFVASNAVSNVASSFGISDMGQIDGFIYPGYLDSSVRVVVSAGHGSPGSSFVPENRMEYYAQPCSWYNCVNQVYYRIGTLDPAADYSVVAFLDKNNNGNWDCPDSANCERYAYSRSDIAVTANSVAQADVVMSTTAQTPDAPQSFYGTAISTSQVLWTWSDLATETTYYLTNQFTVKVATLAANTTFYIENVDLANTAGIVRGVRGYNGAGDGPLSSTMTVYTKAYAPVLSTTAVTASGVTLSISSATARFTLFRSTAAAGGYVMVYNLTTGSPITSRTDSGLNPNTTYYYKALSYNFDSVPSVFSSTVSALTTDSSGAFLIGTVTYSGLMTGNITVLASTVSSMQSPITLVLAGNTTQSYYLTGISLSTACYMRAFVDYNADGLLSAYEDANNSSIMISSSIGSAGGFGPDIEIVKSTAPPPSPTGLVATPGFQKVDLQWNAPNVPNLIGYEVERSTYASFSAAVAKISGNSLVTGNVFTDLNPITGFALYYRVRAVNWGLNPSTWTVLNSFVNVSAGGSITGIVYAVDTSTQGFYHVRVSTTPDATAPSLRDVIVSTSPAAYTVSGLVDGAYYVRGYRDLNSDFKQDGKTEPSGTHGGIARPFDLYITQGNSLTGVDLTACDRIPLAVSASTTPEISSTGCQALDRGPGYYTRIFTFEVGYGAGKIPPGSELSIYNNMVGGSGITDPYLFLVGPSGDVVAYNDDDGGSLNSRIQHTVNTQGVYLIEPTSYSAGQSGPVNVGFDVTGGFGGRLTGSLNYYGTMTGTNTVQVFETLNAYAWPVMTATASPSGFEIAGLRDGGFYLKVFMDVNGNSVQDPFEPYGVYGGTTAVQFSVSGGVADVTLAVTLAEPAMGSASGLLSYSGERSGNIRIEAARPRNGDLYDMEVIKFSTITRSGGAVSQAYQLQLLPPATDYTIQAFVDENNNSERDLMEAGISTRPITIMANTTTYGVDLAMVNPGSGEVGTSSFTGVVTYLSTDTAGAVWVGWALDDMFEDIAYSTTVSVYADNGSTRTWTYFRGSVLGGTSYYMAAFLDINGNSQPDEKSGEPMGMYSEGAGLAQVYVPVSSEVVRALPLVPPSTGSVGGTVYYYGSMSGPARVWAWNQACENSGAKAGCYSESEFDVLQGTNAYPFALSFLDPATSYQVAAVIDLNGNHRTDPGEPNAFFSGYTLSGSSTAVLTIMDPGQMSGGNVGEIRGSLNYGGIHAGFKVVRLFLGSLGGVPIRTTNASACAGSTCTFVISGLPYATNYYLDAFVDSSGNGLYEPASEPYGGQGAPISLSVSAPFSLGNYLALTDPGSGGGVSGSGVLQGSVFIKGGTPSGTLRVQLFKFNESAGVMQVPVRSTAAAYVSSVGRSTIPYVFAYVPEGDRYLVQAFVDSTANFFPDRNEAWGQTNVLNQGIQTTAPVEQMNLAVCARTSIDPGQNLSGALENTDCVSPDRGQASAYADYYSFQGSAGNAVTIEMAGTDFSDTYLYLYGPVVTGTSTYGGGASQSANAYNLLAADDDSAGNLNSKINSFTLPGDGIYTIAAASYGSNITGAYTVSLRVSGGMNGSIAGTVRYNGTQGGNVNVGLFNVDPRNSQNAIPVTGTSMNMPGAFSFNDLPTGTTYYIAGFIDVNANNSPDVGEDFGLYPNQISLRSGQNMSGILMEINPSTAAVFVGGAGQGTLSGSISYAGASTATTLVIEMWNTATFRGMPVGIRTMQIAPENWPTPVTYDLQVPGDQTYYLKAFLDTNSNRMPDTDEAKGSYEPNNEGPEPIYVGSAAYVSDKGFTLYDPGQTLTGGASGAAGEGWAVALPTGVPAGSQFTSTVAVRINGLGTDGVVMLGMPNNLYTQLQTFYPSNSGYVRVSTDGVVYSTPTALAVSLNNAQYRTPAGGLAAATTVYFAISNLYAPCQGGVSGPMGVQVNNIMTFNVGTSSNTLQPQPLVSGQPAFTLTAGAPQNLSFRLADSANGYNMAVPNGIGTAMVAEARDNCWNIAPSSFVYIATVSAYMYDTSANGYVLDNRVKFSSWTVDDIADISTAAAVRFDAGSSTGTFYIKPTAQGYMNIGLSYNLAWSNTFYMGVQVMAGGGISGANVSTGAYNNVLAGSMTVTITPNGDGNDDRAYINFLMGDSNMGWHVMVSSIPFGRGVTPNPVWETWGWGQPNPGQTFWEGRYSPWMNNGGVLPTGAYFVRIEAGSLRNDTLRINVVVPQVSGQVTDSGTNPERPLAGVSVNAYGMTGWGQAITDSGGNFTIPGLAQGQYNFQFSKEEYGMVSSQTAIGANGGTLNVSMRRAPALILVPLLANPTTQMFDQWGWINIHTTDWSRSYNGSLRVAAGTTTIDDGGRWDASTNQFVTRRRIYFNVEPATYIVEAELSGYGRISTTVYVGSAGLELIAPTTLPSFTRKANISGRVTLPSANPNGTWVSVNAMPVVPSSSVMGGWGGVWLNPAVTVSTYNIYGLDQGTYMIRAQVPGYSGVSSGPVTVGGTDITGWNMPEFGSGAVIRGTVTVSGDTSQFSTPTWMNNWKNPIRVNINVWSPQTYTNGWTEVYVATAGQAQGYQAQSTFTITGLDAGTTYQLFANLDFNRDGGGNAEFTVPGGFPKQVYVDASTETWDTDFSFAMASGAIVGTILLPTPSTFSALSMNVRVTQSDNPYNVGQSFFIQDMSPLCSGSNCLPGGLTTYESSATFKVSGMETQTMEITFTYDSSRGGNGMSRTAVLNIISGSTATVVVDLNNTTYQIYGSITNQISNPSFNTMGAAIRSSSFTFPSGYPVVSTTTLPIEAVRRDLNQFGAAISAAFDPSKTRVGFITQAGTYTIAGLQEGVYVVRTLPLKTCATCEMLVAAQEKVVTIRGADYANKRVLMDGVYVGTGSVNFTLIDGWNVSGSIAIENSVSDARALMLTLRNRRNEVVRSTSVALGNAATNSLANSVAYSFTRLPGGEFYTLEVKDTRDSNGITKYAASPLRFPDIGSSPNGMQSDLSGQNITLRQGAMLTFSLRDVNSATLITPSNYSLLAPNFSCYATANPWVQGGYYLAVSSSSNRPAVDANGTVRVGPVMPGVYYDVKCEQSNWDVGYMRSGAQNYSPAVVSGVRPSAGETRDLGVLDLRQGQALSGSVRDRSGQALVNVKVIARPSNIENPITVQSMTNRDGRYTLWVSTYVSRYFDITAAPWEQNQSADASTIVYRESVYRAVDLTRSSSTVDFTLDAVPGGVSGSVVTIDTGALSYPFGEMQGFPAAALFIQPYGTVPKNNPLGDIEAVTEPGGAFSVPLSTGAYTIRVVSLGYSVPSSTFVVTGSGMVNIGTTTLVKGGTVTGQIRKPDSTAQGGYTEPNSDEITLVAAANDGFTEFVMGTVVSDPVSRTITRYAISGFKPEIDYSLALMSSNGDLAFPSEGGVRFSQDESTATKSVNLIFRPSRGDCMVVAKRVSAGMQLKFVCSKALRNRTFDDGNLSLILTTSSVDASGAAIASPDGTGSLVARELSADRKKLTVIYSTTSSEGMFSIRLAAYTSEVDQATGDNFRIDRIYDFYTGIQGVAAGKINNMNGGRVELEGDDDEDELGSVEFPPGTFALNGSTYALVGTTVTVELSKAENRNGRGSGVSALGAGGSSSDSLASIRHTLPDGLYEAMQALREGKVGNYRTKASASASVSPFSSFYDITLPAGISHVLQQPARLTMSYDAALSSGDTSNLNVYYYNPDSRRYVLERAGRAVDTDNATISVNVDHLSVFVVLAQAPVEGAAANEYTGDELKAHNFPNPFNNTRRKSISLNDAIATGGYSAAAVPCVTQGTCVRVFIPRGTSGEMYLKIFNIAGELVREMQLTGYSAGTTTVWPWDGLNGSGEKVASGVYIGEVKVGSDKAFFKMAVIKSSKYQ